MFLIRWKRYVFKDPLTTSTTQHYKIHQECRGGNCFYRFYLPPYAAVYSIILHQFTKPPHTENCSKRKNEGRNKKEGAKLLSIFCFLFLCCSLFFFALPASFSTKTKPSHTGNYRKRKNEAKPPHQRDNRNLFLSSVFCLPLSLPLPFCFCFSLSSFLLYLPLFSPFYSKTKPPNSLKGENAEN